MHIHEPDTTDDLHAVVAWQERTTQSQRVTAQTQHQINDKNPED